MTIEWTTIFGMMGFSQIMKELGRPVLAWKKVRDKYKPIYDINKLPRKVREELKSNAW